MKIALSRNQKILAFFIVFIIFICGYKSCPVDPVQLFSLTSDVQTIYDVIITRNGTQLYIACVLNNQTFALRKYAIGGNTYFLKTQFKGPSATTHYDYIFLTSKYFVAGSKRGGFLRLWNITSTQYINQVSNSIFAIKIVYSPTLQKFGYLQNTTKIFKTISISNLSTPASVVSSNWKGDDIQINPSGILLVIFNETLNSNYVLDFTSLSLTASITSSHIGDKSGAWSKNSVYYFLNTVKTVSNLITTYVETYNFSSVLQPTTNLLAGAGGAGGAGSANTAIIILTALYSYDSVGRANNSLYIQAYTEILVPLVSSINTVSFIGVTYPIPARRLLQTLNFNYDFYLPTSSEYNFFYDSQKIYFGVVVGGVLFYFSFHQSCLTDQYLDSASLFCLPCLSGCAKCNEYECLQCMNISQTVDPITKQCVYQNLMSNITNSSISSNITIPSNITILSNITINPLILNTINPQYQKNKINSILAFVRQLYFNFLLKLLNKVPGSRKVFKPLFKFFVNLDDLWLYYYHKRSYCNTTKQMFESIKEFQNQKWQAVKFDKVLSLAKIGQQDIQNYMSYLDTISQHKDNFYLVEQKNDGYFINTIDFYFSNFFLIILTFLILRLVFNLTKNMLISIFFRQYSFNIYLGIMIMQGNLQYFVYLIFNEIQMLFSDYLIHKLIHSYSIITFLALLIFSSFCYTLIYFMYKQKNGILRYFFQNFKVLSKGHLYLFLIFFTKNFVLGFIHSFFDYNYFLKIGLLWTCELMFLLIYLNLIAKKYLQTNFSLWIVIYCGLLRLLIISSFYMDYVMKNQFAEMETFQGILFMVYLVFGLVSMVYQVSVFIYDTICLYKKRNVYGEASVKDIKPKLNKYKYKAFNVQKYQGRTSSQSKTSKTSQITQLNPKSSNKLLNLKLKQQQKQVQEIFSVESLVSKSHQEFDKFNEQKTNKNIKNLKKFKRIPKKWKIKLQPVQQLYQLEKNNKREQQAQIFEE